MTKTEAYKVAANLRSTYQALRECVDGVRCAYVSLNLLNAPSGEEITALSNYLIESEDVRLYTSTFGVMDLGLLRTANFEMNDLLNGYGADVRGCLAVGDCWEIVRSHKEAATEIFNLEYALSLFGAIWYEAGILKPIFERLISSPLPLAPASPIVPKTGTADTAPDGLSLPPTLDTPEARKYILRAIEAGRIQQTAEGLRWVQIGGRGGNAQLGYFLAKVYKQPRPINDLEEEFGVKKLSAYLCRADNLKDDDIKHAGVRQWIAEIDRLFED